MTDGRQSRMTRAQARAEARRRARNRRILAAAIAVVLAAALVFLGTLAYPRITGGASARDGAASGTSAASAASKDMEDTTTANTGGDVARAKPPEPNHGRTRVEAARQAAETAIGQYPGTWSVHVVDLESGLESAAGSDQPMVAASLIKLYIMLAVFDGINQGTIADGATIDADLTQMITVSSNDAANRLLAVIGGTSGTGGTGGTAQAIATVTDTAARYGFTDTKELRALTGAASGNTVENWTSARDCALFLVKAYRGELVSQDASKRMTDLLLGQTRRTKIPAGVPAGVQVANKTGELAAVQNDVAIVYAPHPYVFAVMANDVDESAAGRIASLSAAVYQAFAG
ncbi:serine hydrolase [Bifidobacterium saguinibicoloris]|uniref:serine hydrolase n=1 Tax=Bifidobacterium saguinibicoloris TaxID=2834433 RepID=UPI001F3B4C15|nr:serine hydrolase [Bifidobacterium saguinibicoloris]